MALVRENTAIAETANPGLVLVVDDEGPLRSSLRSLMRSAGFDVAVFESCDDFLSYDLEDVPCCLLLDLRMRGQSGLDLQARLLQDKVDIPIIFLTACGDISTTVAAMKAGAHDFLCKPIAEQDLMGAVASALEKHRAVRTARRKLEEVRRSYEALSSREGEVMRHVALGMNSKEIARLVGISEITASIHLENAMKKMNAHSFPQLVLRARQLQLC